MFWTSSLGQIKTNRKQINELSPDDNCNVKSQCSCMWITGQGHETTGNISSTFSRKWNELLPSSLETSHWVTLYCYLIVCFGKLLVTRCHAKDFCSYFSYKRSSYYVIECVSPWVVQSSDCVRNIYRLYFGVSVLHDQDSTKLYHGDDSRY